MGEGGGVYTDFALFCSTVQNVWTVDGRRSTVLTSGKESMPVIPICYSSAPTNVGTFSMQYTNNTYKNSNDMGETTFDSFSHQHINTHTRQHV